MIAQPTLEEFTYDSEPPKKPGRLPLDRVQAEPDLTRTESGYLIKLFLDALPPTKATIEVHAGNVLLDSVKTTGLKGHEVYRHTTLYSEPYAEALR